MSYFDFSEKIKSSEINCIFELGSRDLIDSIKLQNYYKCKIYSFECNPDCLVECKKNYENLNEFSQKNIFLIEKAVSLNDGEAKFYPFDLTKYDNMGSSSMYKIDFSMRHPNDPDFNRENPQKEIIVDSVRLDTFINENHIQNIDLLCIDLQGYELNAIKSLGEHLHNVKYIIIECSIKNTYINGCSFLELSDYLKKFNFTYRSSNKFGDNLPDLSLEGFSEFDALFVNNNLV